MPMRSSVRSLQAQVRWTQRLLISGEQHRTKAGHQPIVVNSPFSSSVGNNPRQETDRLSILCISGKENL